jgi:hypothetical protein
MARNKLRLLNQLLEIRATCKNGVPEKTLCRYRLDAAPVPRPFILLCFF